MVRIPAHIAVFLIRLYQTTLGRVVGGRCRFHPSCSHYAVEAIETYGLVAGGARATWRVMRCGPWSAGGIDPVRRPVEAVRG